MADLADGDGVADIFIYRGGLAPRHVTHVRIDRSVKMIDWYAFLCLKLVQVETHDGIRRVGMRAFQDCKLLRRINLRSVVQIGEDAFHRCENLTEVEFGGELETIRRGAFHGCSCVTSLKLPSIITIAFEAFCNCKALTDIELSERLEKIRPCAFSDCSRLQHIAIPLKRDLFALDVTFRKYNQFDGCYQLTTVDLVGETHIKTIASLHMESWSTEMQEEINRINQVLPNTPAVEKTDEIRQWMDSVLDKMDHYKAEHCRFVKETITLLELALWKAKLGEKEESCAEGRTKKAKVDAGSARREKRITCGADMVIKNVLPFLQLE